MSEKDTVTKSYMQDNTFFADAFNFLMYDGKQVIDPAQLRACLESPRVRMAPSDFSPDDAKTAGNTLCINEDFGKIWRKRCKPAVRGEILNRL